MRKRSCIWAVGGRAGAQHADMNGGWRLVRNSSVDGDTLTRHPNLDPDVDSEIGLDGL